MRFFTSWSCYSCFDDGISFCNSQLYLNFSSIQSIKWAARQMWNERLSQLVLLQSTFSLPLHIHLWVDKFTLRVVTVAASDITLMCMFVRFLHYHNLSVCVRECVCAWNSWWICQRLQSSRRLSHWWTSCSDVYRDLLFNSGASQKNIKGWRD